MRRRTIITSLCCVLALLLAVSCGMGRGGRIIPRGKMSKIYARMLITDQWISDNGFSRQADTSLVYEPIFKSYGYNADDYRASMAYYMEDPARYEKMIIRSRKMLEQKLNEVKAEKAKIDAAAGKEPYYLNARYDQSIFVPKASCAEDLIMDTLRLFHDTLVFNLRNDMATLADTLSVCYHPVEEDLSMELQVLPDEDPDTDSVQTIGGVEVVDGEVPPDALEVLQEEKPRLRKALPRAMEKIEEVN
ncbi:MAG: DUF4296 domain-containing protein [Bacteroidales bacterium]|nr:DUF4296 domain-containing protein [Bacteroidales bacterium]